MKIETQKYGLLAKDKEKKVVQIGKEWLSCPSCGSALKEAGAKCEMCGAVQGAQGEAVTSTLSDEELRDKLQAVGRKTTIAKSCAVLFAVAALVTLALRVWLAFIPCLIASVVCFFIRVLSESKTKQLISVNIVRDALSEVFDVEFFEPRNHIESKVVSDAELVYDWNEISGSDLVRGRYKGIPFIFSDIKLVDVQESTDSDGHSQETRTTRFQGQWIILDTKRATPHRVRLRERGQRKLTGSYKKSKSDVETENAAFNEKFEILTGDAHTAFYILTPHFMETIVAADESAAGRTYMCFTGQQAQIAVHTGRDSFELGKGKETKNLAALRQRIQGEVKYITAIVDELMQNQYLFGEEN